MLTKEDREEIKKTVSYGYDWKVSLQKVKELLGALDEMENKLESKTTSVKRLRSEKRSLVEAIKDLRADRGRWKARAEAYDKAVRGDCRFCIHYEMRELSGGLTRRIISGNACENCSSMNSNMFEFDVARFAGGE